MSCQLLSVNNLKVAFSLKKTAINVLNGVDLSIHRGEKVALVGESGCGKSVLALALFGLLPVTARVSGSAIYDKNIDLLSLPEKEKRRFRGRTLALVPQNPLSHLNPLLRIGYQVEEGLKQQHSISRKKARETSLSLLSMVGFQEPEKLSIMYPHQLSGGMAQRVLLAIGLGGNPEIVIADEPTRGLDAENEALYLNLISDIYRDCGLLMITHSLEVAGRCDWIYVMYGGEIVEGGPARRILANPGHPYTRGLLRAHPEREMCPIPGQAVSFTDIPSGCRFHPRCTSSSQRCVDVHPDLIISPETALRCHHAAC